MRFWIACLNRESTRSFFAPARATRLSWSFSPIGRMGDCTRFLKNGPAGFFALGRIAQSGRPKAVITTSGTAVANLLPAVIEAHYTGAPLVCVTADRPRSYRGTGSPQTIVQPGIFSSYATMFRRRQRRRRTQISKFPKNGPSHLNVCFDEPLVDHKVEPWSARFAEPKSTEAPKSSTPALPQLKRPLIVVGALPERVRGEILNWLSKQNCPLYVEAPSGLRGHERLRQNELHAGDKTLKTDFFDGLIRVGHIPTARVWRDMEKSTQPVVSFSELPFSGLARTDCPVFSLSALGDHVWTHPQLTDVLEKDMAEAERLTNLLEKYPQSELALVRKFSEAIGAQDSVYLGNSLPIREWDLGRTPRFLYFEGLRESWCERH